MEAPPGPNHCFTTWFVLGSISVIGISKAVAQTWPSPKASSPPPPGKPAFDRRDNLARPGIDSRNRAIALIQSPGRARSGRQEARAGAYLHGMALGSTAVSMLDSGDVIQTKP